MNDNSNESVPEVIWVDRDMKRCGKSLAGARRATYKKEYELYVIDH